MGNHALQSAVSPNWFLATHDNTVVLEPTFHDKHAVFHFDRHGNHFVLRTHGGHYLAASKTGQLYVHHSHLHADCKFKIEQTPTFPGQYEFQSYHGQFIGVRNNVVGCYSEFTPCEAWLVYNDLTSSTFLNSIARSVGVRGHGTPVVASIPTGGSNAGVSCQTGAPYPGVATQPSMSPYPGVTSQPGGVPYQGQPGVAPYPGVTSQPGVTPYPGVMSQPGVAYQQQTVTIQPPRPIV